MIFAHVGFRPLWPALLFLPLLLVGVAFILESVLHRRSLPAPIRPVSGLPSRNDRHPRHRASHPPAVLGFVALGLLVTAAPVTLADPAPEEHPRCAVSSRQEARSLGDELFEQGAYQHAGECYQAAGELALADRAFVRAVEPQSAQTARKLADQGNQAKALARKVQQAFRTDH
jgi:hypothetical protein